MTGEFPAQTASNAENVSIWWCHHELHGDEWLQMVAVDIHIDDCSNFIANGLELLQSCSNPSICTWDKCTWKYMCYCVTFRKLNCITPDRTVVLINFLPYSGATAQTRSVALWGVSGSYGQAPAQQGMSGLVRETSHLWLYSSPSPSLQPILRESATSILIVL